MYLVISGSKIDSSPIWCEGEKNKTQLPHIQTPCDLAPSKQYDTNNCFASALQIRGDAHASGFRNIFRTHTWQPSPVFFYSLHEHLLIFFIYLFYFCQIGYSGSLLSCSFRDLGRKPWATTLSEIGRSGSHFWEQYWILGRAWSQWILCGWVLELYCLTQRLQKGTGITVYRRFTSIFTRVV